MRTNKKGLSELKGLKIRAPAPAAPKPAPVVIDDVSLFRRAVKSVRPIKDSHHALLPPVPVAPAPLLRRRREAATGKDPLSLPKVSDRFTPARQQYDESRFIKTGCGPDLIKGLKRSKWPIGASLDLHGSTLEEARGRLDQFLESCITHQIKCVRVVHGKGYGSKDGASVLKHNVRRWLTQIDPVLAYIECSEQDGGAGAVRVLLRANEPLQPGRES